MRDDGKVFEAYIPTARNGEWWVSMEKFMKRHGADYWEKRKLRDARAAIPVEQRQERERKYAREYQAKRRSADPQKYKEAARALHLRRRDTPERREQVRRAMAKYYAKKNADKILANAEKKRLSAELKEMARVERAVKIEAAAMQKAERERLKALRPPKVVLTDEQRKERRREDKRNYKHRRRAKLRGLEVKATPKQLRVAKDKAKGRCYYCDSKVKMLTLDHVVPLAKGGSHTLDNIVFACHACNSEKRDLPAHEWAGKFGMLIV